MTTEEKQYKDGFNHGYILTAHEPELATAIIQAAHTSNSRSEYAHGLSLGHDMYIVDHSEHSVTPKKEMSKPAKELESLPTPEKKFTKGFNAGYLIAKYEPELVAKIVKLPNDKSDYFKGIVSGKQEYDMEKIKGRLKGITKDNTPTKGKNIEKGRGK